MGSMEIRLRLSEASKNKDFKAIANICKASDSKELGKDLMQKPIIFDSFKCKDMAKGSTEGNLSSEEYDTFANMFEAECQEYEEAYLDLMH